MEREGIEMSKLTIETFWNKVEPQAGAPFGTRVLPEYERKDVVSYADPRSQEEWRKTLKPAIARAALPRVKA